MGQWLARVFLGPVFGEKRAQTSPFLGYIRITSSGLRSAIISWENHLTPFKMPDFPFLKSPHDRLTPVDCNRQGQHIQS